MFQNFDASLEVTNRSVGSITSFEYGQIVNRTFSIIDTWTGVLMSGESVSFDFADLTLNFGGTQLLLTTNNLVFELNTRERDRLNNYLNRDVLYVVNENPFANGIE